MSQTPTNTIHLKPEDETIIGDTVIKHVGDGILTITEPTRMDGQQSTTIIANEFTIGADVRTEDGNIVRENTIFIATVA